MFFYPKLKKAKVLGDLHQDSQSPLPLDSDPYNPKI